MKAKSGEMQTVDKLVQKWINKSRGGHPTVCHLEVLEAHLYADANPGEADGVIANQHIISTAAEEIGITVVQLKAWHCLYLKEIGSI